MGSRAQRGAAVTEYAGLLAVVALLVTAAAGAAPGVVVAALQRAVCAVTVQPGCAAAPGTLPVPPSGQPGDRDGDGLSDADEAELGSDPDRPDWRFPFPQVRPDRAHDSRADEYGSDSASLGDRGRVLAAHGLAEALDARGYDVAARHLRHYLDNNGEDLDVDIPALLQAQPAAQAAVARTLDGQLTDAYADARERHDRTGTRVVVPIDSGWRATAATDGDWYYALGGFSHSYTGLLTIDPPATPGGEPQVRVEYQLHVTDYYNWDSDDSTYGVSHEHLRELHDSGLAREFSVRASDDVTVREGTPSELGLG